MNGVDKAALSQTVQNADALGATPIAKSLLAAADDFPATAERRLIVLVTDGEESCGGDLQVVARDLRNRGFEIDIRIIGFDLDNKAIQSFEGIGTFENAENAAALAQALETAVQDVVAEVPVVKNDCDVAANIITSESVEASHPFNLDFEGPEGRISLHPAGGDQFSSLDMTLTLNGNPAELLAPSEAGDYEIRYTATSGNCVIASTPLAVTPVQASLSARAQVEAGFAFPFEFSGPEGVIAIFKPDDASNNNYSEFSYHFTRWDPPANLTAPTEAGSYEIRYLDNNRAAVAETQLEVLASAASLAIPEQVEAGFEFVIEFSGPEGIVAIYKPDDTNNGNYNDFSYYFTRWDPPSTLTAPAEAGTYEVRYIDENRGTLSTVSLIVLPSAATLSTTAQVEAGYPIVFEAAGPEGIVAIYNPEAPSRDYNEISYYFTKWNNNPSTLTAPTEAGTYELRYIDDSKGTLVTAPIEILASTATINAPAEISAGTAFTPEISGPEGIVAIFEAGSQNRDYNNISYYFTKWDARRSVLTAPETPGTYEIRYLDGHQGTLVSHLFTVR